MNGLDIYADILIGSYGTRLISKQKVYKEIWFSQSVSNHNNKNHIRVYYVD